jgi:hypothetical protein
MTFYERWIFPFFLVFLAVAIVWQFPLLGVAGVVAYLAMRSIRR